MEEERILKLSLEKAKQWYNGSSQDLKRIALEVYTEEELTKVELPNSWEEYYLSQSIATRKAIKIKLVSLGGYNKYAVLFKLELLRDCYRQGWKPDWSDSSFKYCIKSFKNKIDVDTCMGSSSFLSFKSYKIRDKFLENFRDIIEEAGDLI